MSSMEDLTLIVMGVCGVGKTSVARALSERLSGLYVEADEFHPEENIDAMRRGVPLTDAMREPWLRGISNEIQSLQKRFPGKNIVVACSALKRSYRDILRTGLPEASFVFLTAPRDLIAERMAARTDHFMPLTLLDSQFADLETPADGENHLTIDASPDKDRIVDAVLAQLECPAPKPGQC